METPSSVRRSTRSHTMAAASATSNNGALLKSKKLEESRQKNTGNQQTDRSFLLDITNDSPIVGLADGSLKTPSSDISRKRNVNRCWEIRTPGSGEALLRGQVKTLLQKVEEEAEISKVSLNLHGFVKNSSSGILAPANTPQIPCLLDQESFKDACFDSVTISPVQENYKISQLVSELFDGGKEDGSDIISRSLLSEFSDKVEGYGSSLEIKSPSTTDDDNSSVWSIQVNASIRADDEEEEEDFEEEEKEDEMELLDELCKGISKMQVGGKHTRFVYDSDDELVKEEDVEAEGILKLKGLPTPQGKHLRFPQEEEEEESMKRN